MNQFEIRHLTAIEAIRVRPAMYIGSTDLFGLLNYLAESIKVMLVHQARHIHLSIESDELHVSSDATFHFKSDDVLPSLFEQLYAPGDGTIPVALNALSEHLKILVTSEHKKEVICYRKGERVSREIEALVDGKAGATFHFKPDDSIFSVMQIPCGMIASHFRQISYLYPGVRFSCKDEKNSLEFYSEHGLINLFAAMTSPYQLLHQPIHITALKDKLSLELVFAYQTGKADLLLSFANNLQCLEGGSHEDGLREAFPQMKSTLGLPADFHYGCLALFSLYYPNICWGGGKRSKVSNPDLSQEIREVIASEVEHWTKQNPDILDQLRLIPISSQGNVAQ